VSRVAGSHNGRSHPCSSRQGSDVHGAQDRRLRANRATPRPDDHRAARTTETPSRRTSRGWRALERPRPGVRAGGWDTRPPKRISYTFRNAVERAELPYLSRHGLRHTFATVALEAGVLTKVVADVLGHSSATITADLYSHTTEPTTRAASDTVASAMFGTRR
jgi:hypothetical protein